MRMLIRLALLALAAVGAKSLYDRLSLRAEQLEQTGSEFVKRAGSAVRDVGTKATSASQRVASVAKENLHDVRSTAGAKAGEVKQAADDAIAKASDQLSADTDATPATAVPE